MSDTIKTCLRNAAIGVPLLFQSILFNVMFYCDSFLLGFVGEHEVSAVSAGSQVIWLYEALITCPAYVCGTIVGRLEGAGRRSEIRTAISRCFAFTGALVLIVGSGLFMTSQTVSFAMIHNPDAADMMTTYVRWATVAFAISTLGTVAEYALQNMKEQRKVLSIYICEFAIKLSASVFFLFCMHLGIFAIILGMLLSKIARVVMLLFTLLHKMRGSVSGRGCAYEYSWKSYTKQCVPLGLSVLLWNISTIIISSSFGRLDISAYTAYALLNNAVYIILIPTEAYTKSLAVLVARLIGASSGLSPEYVHSRLQVMRSANVMIGVISVCISYIYISVIPLMQPGISTRVWSQVHVIVLPFLGYIACKSITDSITEGFLRPVLDNAFLFLVEFLALPCTIIVFYVLSISLLDGFWYLFGLELFRMVLVCIREAVWIRSGLPGTAKDAGQ